MEVIAASLMTNSTVHEAGLQLANHAPDKSGNKDTQTILFPSDPSVGFHKYTWVVFVKKKIVSRQRAMADFAFRF
jgi:hypothetical protein